MSCIQTLNELNEANVKWSIPKLVKIVPKILDVPQGALTSMFPCA